MQGTVPYYVYVPARILLLRAVVRQPWSASELVRAVGLQHPPPCDLYFRRRQGKHGRHDDGFERKTSTETQHRFSVSKVYSRALRDRVLRGQ